jgi:formyl-CoA transferase
MLSLPPDIRAYTPAPSAGAALSGVRVIDFSRMAAGPFGTQILGDLGAEVIKIENPVGGDDMRGNAMLGATAGESASFLALNRSKKSVAVDLKSEAGRQVALDLIATADVVVENFTAGVMRRFQLDYPSLQARFPRLIYCSVSGYGRTGPNSEAAGYDFTVAADAGLIALNADAGAAPTQGLIPHTDLSTALNSVIGVLAALHARAQTGRGQHVDVAMFDTALANLTSYGLTYFITGQEPKLSPAQTARPRGRFVTADGAMVMVVTGAKMFRAFCLEVVDRPQWLEDPRWRDEATRMTDVALLEELNTVLSARDTAYWVGRCRKAGIPCGPIQSPGQALTSEAARSREMVLGLPHPTIGLVPTIAPGFRMSEAPFRHSAPPLLGQHTKKVLMDLPGYDEAWIERLAADGAIALGLGG